jgi:hypothetical protein
MSALLREGLWELAEMKLALSAFALLRNRREQQCTDKKIEFHRNVSALIVQPAHWIRRRSLSFASSATRSRIAAL